MFLSDSHMPQLLPAEAYHSEEQMQREIDRLLMPSWHLVGSTVELAAEGDYLLQEVLGRPIIVWRNEGQLHAFLNVCAHRSCMLTHREPFGNMPRLKCQYHGWEYDQTGNTRKIPDAKSFRPLEPGMVGLKKYRVETCGTAVFVTLADDAPSLAEYLGPGYELCNEVTGDGWKLMTSSVREVDCNWKVYVENTMESYHVEAVHPQTIKKMPEEETCIHEFDDKWSLLLTRGKDNSLDLLDRVAHRVLGVARDPDYHNLLIYPNIAVGKLSLFSWVDEVVPVGPNRMRVIARGYSHTAEHGPLRSGLLGYLVRRWGRKFLNQLVMEDSIVFQGVQRGLRSPQQPQGGLISTREERVYHFQNYIKRHTLPEGDASPETSNGVQSLAR